MKHIIETEHWSGLCSKKKIASAKGLHLTLVVNCVFNAFFSLTTIVLNILTIQALRKTPSLPKTLKTLLLSLAVSDLVVGLLVQLLYVAILVMNIQQNTESIAYVTVYKAFFIQKKILVLASHFGVISLTVDRFLAIHLHLRYQELVTHKRVVSVVFDFGFFFYTTSYCSCLCHNYRIALLQSMRSCKTPHRYK